MRRLRRPVAVLSMLLIQLMLVVGAYGCATVGVRAGAESMAGMAMPDGGAAMTPVSSPSGDRELPCQLPSSPNGCQSMAACTIASLAVASTHDDVAAPEPRTIMTLELLTPTPISRAPELPPPRA